MWQKVFGRYGFSQNFRLVTTRLVLSLLEAFSKLISILFGLIAIGMLLVQSVSWFSVLSIFESSPRRARDGIGVEGLLLVSQLALFSLVHLVSGAFFLGVNTLLKFLKTYGSTDNLIILIRECSLSNILVGFITSFQ